MIDVTVPTWGLTMDEAVLSAWMKSVGDVVAAGEALAEIETDKASGDLESPAAGVLVEVLVDEGAFLEAGQVVARIEES